LIELLKDIKKLCDLCLKPFLLQEIELKNMLQRFMYSKSILKKLKKLLVKDEKILIRLLNNVIILKLISKMMELVS
jgi:hypothetical protein